MEIRKTEEIQVSTKTEEAERLDITIDTNNDESLDQIELKIEKEEIISSGDFYSNPRRVNKKIQTPMKNINISYRYKKLGNTFTCLYNSEGDPMILIGPHCKKNII